MNRAKRMLRYSFGVIALLTFPSAFAQASGLPTGTWEVKIFAPVPTPELKNDEQVFRICYDEAAVESHLNPVLPKAQAEKCQLNFTDMGDFAYDAICDDGDHRLRISESAEGLWRGTYRFLGKADGTMLEPAVELNRVAETCE